MTQFWRRWLQAASLFLVAYGLLMCMAVLPPLDGPVRLLIDLSTWPMPAGPVELDLRTVFVTGVGGAMLAGWGIMIWFAVSHGLERPDMDWVRRSLAAGIFVWFVLDCLVSIEVGAYANVGFNCLLALILLLPILKIAALVREAGVPA